MRRFRSWALVPELRLSSEPRSGLRWEACIGEQVILQCGLWGVLRLMTSEHPWSPEEWESPDEARLLVKATQTGEEVRERTPCGPNIPAALLESSYVWENNQTTLSVLDSYQFGLYNNSRWPCPN